MPERIIHIHPDPEPLWVATADGRAVPNRFWAEVDDPDLEHVVRIQIYASAEGAQVRQVVVSRREEEWPFGPQVTTVALRKVNLKTYVAAALAQASRKRTDRGDGTFLVEGDDRHAYGGPKLGQKGRRTSDDRLDVVADAYLKAQKKKTSTRRAVMEAAGVGTAQAAKLIRAARDAGKLPPLAALPQPPEPAAPTQAPEPVAHPDVTTAEFLAKIHGVRDIEGTEDVVSPRDRDGQHHDDEDSDDE